MDETTTGEKLVFRTLGKRLAKLTEREFDRLSDRRSSLRRYHRFSAVSPRRRRRRNPSSRAVAFIFRTMCAVTRAAQCFPDEPRGQAGGEWKRISRPVCLRSARSCAIVKAYRRFPRREKPPFSLPAAWPSAFVRTLAAMRYVARTRARVAYILLCYDVGWADLRARKAREIAKKIDRNLLLREECHALVISRDKKSRILYMYIYIPSLILSLESYGGILRD